jgi:hypothetical protein
MFVIGNELSSDGSGTVEHGSRTDKEHSALIESLNFSQIQSSGKPLPYMPCEIARQYPL